MKYLISILSLIFVLNLAHAHTSLEKKIGVFPASSPTRTDGFEQFEDWLGKEIFYYDANLAGRQPGTTKTTMVNDANMRFGNPASANYFNLCDQATVSLTLPLAFGTIGASINEKRSAMQSIADGDADDEFFQVATTLVNNGCENAILRLGHEYSFPASAQSTHGGLHEEFKAAFIRVHDVMSTAPGQKFLFDLNSGRNVRTDNCGCGVAQCLVDADPGPAYVDIYSVNVYSKVPRTIESLIADITFVSDYAESQGKATALGEWGLVPVENNGHGDQPEFVQAIYDWFIARPNVGPGQLVYHVYFDGTVDGRFKLSNFPVSQQLYKDLFGPSVMVIQTTVTGSFSGPGSYTVGIDMALDISEDEPSVTITDFDLTIIGPF